jgi:hypothetical protein
MSVSNVPALTITSTGVNAPATNQVLTGVLQDFNQAFGGNLNIVNPSTPQGYLAQELTQYITQFNALIAYYVSQVDPATSEGRMQDAIGRIYYLTRYPATATVVTCQITGQPGYTLPAGALATDGIYTYASNAAATFSSGGTATVNFANLTLGANPCPANTLNQIQQLPVGSGWETVNNSGAGVIGNNVESTSDFEYRRSNSVAANSQGTPQAIKGFLFQTVPNIIDCYVIDNPTNAPVNVGSTNYSVAANSVYIAVVGGTSAAIGQAIWDKKDLGCSYNGNTSQTVYDTTYAQPQPAYIVTWETPTNLPILFNVSITNSALLPANLNTLVQNAIVAAFTGADGGNRARIGQEIYASRFYAGVSAIPNVSLISIQIGTSTANQPDVAVGIDQMPTISTSNITVTLV